MDCLQATVDEIRTITAQLVHPINIDRSRISAYAGWFDVQFKVPLLIDVFIIFACLLYIHVLRSIFV